jgi:hypothetical protein
MSTRMPALVFAYRSHAALLFDATRLRLAERELPLRGQNDLASERLERSAVCFSRVAVGQRRSGDDVVCPRG